MSLSLSPSLPLSLSLSLFALGCGSSPPAAATTPPPSDDEPSETVVAPPPAPASPVEATAEPAPPFEELLAALEAETPTPWPALANATRTCPPPRGRTDDALGEWFESCDIPAMAAWDERGSRWIVLDVDRSEGGIERVSVIAATAVGDETLLAGELTPELAVQLRTMLRGMRVTRTPSLVTGSARRSFSIVEFPVLVSLGGALAGSHLWIETSTDLDHPEHVLTRVDGEARVELGRRAAELGPCDGDGWYCEASPEEDCTPAQLRAEGRLCVAPVGIEGVATAGGTLVIVGTVAVAGHGGYPPFHWVVPLTP